MHVGDELDSLQTSEAALFTRGDDNCSIVRVVRFSINLVEIIRVLGSTLLRTVELFPGVRREADDHFRCGITCRLLRVFQYSIRCIIVSEKIYGGRRALSPLFIAVIAVDVVNAVLIGVVVRVVVRVVIVVVIAQHELGPSCVL